jgi:sugar phosphate isomerase/epimerase
MTRSLPPLAVSHLTALELPPPALLDAAAAAGCQGAGLRLIPVLPGGGAYSLMDDPALLRETLAAIARTGITVRDLEIVMLRPDTAIGGYRAFLEAGARIGAKHVLVAGYDDDEARLTANFAAFCDLAAPFGLTADLEFMPWSNVPDLATALRVVQTVERPNGGVLLDPLHFARSAGTVADIAKVPRALWHYWQICDGPAEHPGTTEGLLHAAREERLFPGEGGLDLVGITRAMPADLPLSIEVPKATMARIVPGPERIRLAAEATRAFLASVND